MRGWSSLKKEFLKEWIMGLRRCNSPKKNMTILERKKAIKISADIAIASTRKGATCWSRALISNATKNDAVKHLDKQILGQNSSDETTLKVCKSGLKCKNRMRVSNKILKRSCRIRRIRKRKCSAQKMLVRKKTQILKSIIPGGDLMNDEVCLIEETLDYIMYLRAQVDVMRILTGVSKP